MTDYLWLFVISQIAVAGGVYAAIRADLRELMVRMTAAERDIQQLERTQ